ncbi:MAG: bifunctional nuclease family protein [Phycisphaeraceae bacterium]
MAIRMELARILIRETDDTHVVELREVDGDRIFPIVIGFNEAFAIERRLMGQVPPRPQTHELLASVIEELGYSLDHVVINDLRNHTFFARLMLRNGEGQIVDIDSRPSDALAIGVATEAPIYVEEHVLDEVCREA